MTHRQSDEMTLTALFLRDEGLTSDQVAERIGTSPEWVRTATVRVAKEDTATGDDVSGFYGWFGDRRRRARA
jgi:hypothetical protein